MAEPNLLGRCIGVPGLPQCGRKIFADDYDAIELEGGKGYMCGSCLTKQFPLVPVRPQTASQFVALKKKAGKKSAKIDANRFRIRPASNRRRVGIRLPGSKDFETEDRVTRKKRKQPWGMEEN